MGEWRGCEGELHPRVRPSATEFHTTLNEVAPQEPFVGVSGGEEGSVNRDI